MRNATGRKPQSAPEAKCFFWGLETEIHGPNTLPVPSLYSQWRQQAMPAVLREGHTPPPEQFLQQIWQYQRIRRRELRTTDGRRVAVLHPGFMNLEAGPDFQRAYIQVSRAAPIECDVEVDVASGGWQQHGHHTNPAFSGVGLHVVWQAGSGGPTGLPVVELRDQLDAPVDELSQALGQAAETRLQTKAAALTALAKRTNWRQALWEGLFTALGYKQNSWPMRRVAELLSELGQADEPVVLLARLLGVGGLLPDQLDRDKLTNRYLRTLWDQWWRDRDRLAKRILPEDVWTFHGLRPANRPERRLALAAHWLSRPDFIPWLDDWVCQIETRPTPAAAILGHLTASDEYWSMHWTFRSGRFAKAQPLLGAGRLDDIAVNVILPWLYARATEDDNVGLRQRVVERYFAWPKGQDNSRLRFVRQRLLGVRRISLRGAAAQQGLLQVQADFCNRTNALCDDCVFPDLVQRHSLEKR